ncbi:carboxypeptidase-like regulatory domain-containing protein [Hymenobacter sp. BRD67]|uniref:carboxypeptidase-like regulatory domain-containing protein n=1 Tax=Hymenobacter sp. BRD67 TaxID=2675877 RepID=UPI0015665B4E|nr:carboxypeptidase-like regulatory domain-containing protein [Hymenobacter sp. BRD67]QKG54513.1 carboxypeptidase regulatory-like domain-containing protein [Hymenobacter sp. BRD67]
MSGLSPCFAQCRLLALLLVIGAVGCTSVRLPPGSYSETRGLGVIMWEGKTLQIASNHTFAYSRWSDDINSGRYGTGTYQLTGTKLLLQFQESPPIVVGVQAQQLALPPDSLLLTFTILGRPVVGTAEAAPVSGATIAARDEKGKPVAAVSSNAAGRASLRVPPSTAQISVESLGFVTWRQACPPGSTAYRLELPPNDGTAYAAGTVLKFRLVRRPPPNTLVMKRGKNQTVFKRD